MCNLEADVSVGFGSVSSADCRSSWGNGFPDSLRLLIFICLAMCLINQTTLKEKLCPNRTWQSVSS